MCNTSRKDPSRSQHVRRVHCSLSSLSEPVTDTVDVADRLGDRQLDGNRQTGRQKRIKKNVQSKADAFQSQRPLQGPPQPFMENLVQPICHLILISPFTSFCRPVFGKM